jgi:hypothetical protein
MNIVKTMTLTIKPVVALVLLFLSLPQVLHATSVLQVDMEQLLNDAAVIFEGEVIASEAKWNADNTYVSTWVTFRVDDVLKGELPSATIIQSFAGGTVGDTTLEVSGMVYPQVGETGIYFIENPDRQQVNPIVGWSQGHFKVKKDKQGKERMLTESDDPIQGIEDVSPANNRGKSAQNESALPLSKGAALGLRVGKSQDALDTAIDKKDFKNALRLRLSLIKTANEAPVQVDKKE